MKPILIFLFFSASFAFGKPLEIALDPKKEDDQDYGEQLIKRFNALLKSSKDLKAQFDVFENPSKERAAGRHLGPTASSLLLHHYVETDFGGDEGEQDYQQTVVLYYSFGEGFHRGMEVTTGVFAVFQITGHQTFKLKDNDEFVPATHTVKAVFKGFQKTFNAEKDAD